MENIQQQFDDFLKDYSKKDFTPSQMSKIFEPLLRQNRRRKFKILAFSAGLLCLTILLIFKYETLSWTLSAIARILFIKLLPYWDWTRFYDAKCLIQREGSTSVSSSLMTPVLGRFETDAENCVLCETVDHIAAISNVTFALLESTYLERGLPVIIIDSHKPKELNELLQLIQNEATDFLDSQPCDLFTNIMLKKLFSLEIALQKLLKGEFSEKWFLQLRNCQFHAVKASRVFITRPYYYPLHLEPFYTSWLLISHNYTMEMKKLYLQGLIFVQQLSGIFFMQLQPKQPCNETCAVVKIQLSAGECLVFSTDLWVFHYYAESSNTTAIATILEIDWQI